MKRVAVLISGRGSNMEALAKSLEGSAAGQIVLVLSSRSDAPGLERAEAIGLPALAIDHRSFATRAEFEAHLLHALKSRSVDLVCLAGFMRVLTDNFVKALGGRLVNIHPSLLPAFKGTRVHEQVIEAGARITGCTVHFVVPAVDAGPAIGQAAVPVLLRDTPQSLAERVARAEHRLYPECLRLLLAGAVTLEGERAVFAGASPPAFWLGD